MAYEKANISRGEYSRRNEKATTDGGGAIDVPRKVQVESEDDKRWHCIC